MGDGDSPAPKIALYLNQNFSSQMAEMSGDRPWAQGPNNTGISFTPAKNQLNLFADLK